MEETADAEEDAPTEEPDAPCEDARAAPEEEAREVLVEEAREALVEDARDVDESAAAEVESPPDEDDDELLVSSSSPPHESGHAPNSTAEHNTNARLNIRSPPWVEDANEVDATPPRAIRQPQVPGTPSRHVVGYGA